MVLDTERLSKEVNAGSITLADLHARIGGVPFERSREDMEALQAKAITRASQVLEEHNIVVRVSILRIFLAIHSGDKSAINSIQAAKLFVDLGLNEDNAGTLAGCVAAFYQVQSESKHFQ